MKIAFSLLQIDRFVEVTLSDNIKDDISESMS